MVSTVSSFSVVAAAVRVDSIDARRAGDRHRFGHAGDFHGDRQGDRLPDGQGHVLLHVRRESREGEGELVGARRELQKDEASVAFGDHAFCARLVSTFRASTVTPGRLAPVASVTVP